MLLRPRSFLEDRKISMDAFLGLYKNEVLRCFVILLEPVSRNLLNLTSNP